MVKIRAYDIMGNVALLKFPEKTPPAFKKKFAQRIMRENSAVKTVLEKTGRFKGRLRKQETGWIAGEKTKKVLYRENGCVFRFNIDKTYFSSRLSNERKEIASMIKKDSTVLVMFAGAGPFSIVIAKGSKAEKVYSNEVNKEANKYGKLNAQLNKVKNKIEFVDGDIKKVALSLKSREMKFDYIVMPRPQLKDSFLKQAFILSKKGTIVFYYDFCRDNEKDMIAEKIKKEALDAKKKVKILRMKTAGEIAPHKIRVRVDFEVL